MLAVPRGRRREALGVVAERTAVLGDALHLRAADTVVGRLHVVADLRTNTEGGQGNDGEEHCDL